MWTEAPKRACRGQERVPSRAPVSSAVSPYALTCRPRRDFSFDSRDLVDLRTHANQGMPADTVFCPTLPTAYPTVAPPPTFSPTSPRTAAPTFAPTAGGPAETYAPTVPLSPTLQVSLQYDISNTCEEFTAENIMNEVDNTLKQGLIAATTSTTIRILNETYPRTEANAGKRRRGLARLGAAAAPAPKSDEARRNLVYYTPVYPVDIVNVIDMQPGNVLIITAVPVVLEPGDDPEAVNAVLVKGLQDSMADGSFFNAIPPDTVYVCS